MHYIENQVYYLMKRFPFSALNSSSSHKATSLLTEPFFNHLKKAKLIIYFSYSLEDGSIKHTFKKKVYKL